MASLGTATLVTRMDLSGLKAGFNQAESLSKQGLTKISADFTRIGRNMSLAVTAPLTAMGVGIVRMSSDFEKSMNRVSALSQATGAELDKLSGLARKLGADTQFSASEAADAMSFLAMAGFDTNQIYDSMADTLNLAAAAQLDMGSAADIVSNIMTGFGVATEDLGSAVDVLTKAFISSNTDLRMLGEGMKYVGPIASGLGVSIEETTAALGSLSNAGIQGGMAGTSLRRILSALAGDAGDLGVAVYDAAGNMRPLADIIDDLNAKGMTTADTLEHFGDRGGPAMQALLSQGGQALRDFTGDLENAGGTAERVATTQMAGLHGMMKELESASQELMLSLGDAGLTDIVKGLVTGVTNLTRSINEAPEGVKRLALGVAGLVAGIGPLLLGLGAVVKLLPIMATGIAVLAGPAGWITLAAVGITGLAVALAGRRSSLDSTAERAQQAMADLDNQAAQTEAALGQLTEATDKDGLRGAVEAMAATLEGEAKQSFITLADQAIASGGDITEIGDTLLELFARLREESLNTRVAAARDLRATAQAQFQQAQAQHALAVESHQFRQQQADRLASANAERASQLEAREAELLGQLAEQRNQLVEARGTAYEGMYQSAVNATQLQLDGVRSQMGEVGLAQEQLSSNLNESAENMRFAAETLGAAHEHLNAELSEQYQNDLFLTGQADSPFSERLRGRTPSVATGGSGGDTLSPGGDDADVPTRTREASEFADALEEVADGSSAADQGLSNYQQRLEGLAAAGREALTSQRELAAILEQRALDGRAGLATRAQPDEGGSVFTRDSWAHWSNNRENEQARAEEIAQLEAARTALNEHTQSLEELARMSREAAAADRERARVLEQNRLARIATAYDVDRAAPASGPTGSEVGVIISTLNSSLRDLELRSVLFGDSLSLANERVRLHETALLEASRVHGENSTVADYFREQLEAARTALERWNGAISRSAEEIINGKIYQDWDSKDFGDRFAQRGVRGAGRDGPDLSEAGVKISEDLDDAGADLAMSIIGAGQSFAGIVSSAQSGNIGGAISGIGGLAGSIMGAIGGAAGPWGAVVSAGVGLIGQLISSAGSGGREREQAAERERQLARSTPAININAVVNQTNNLNGHMMDARTQVELDNRTRNIVTEVLDQIGIQQYLRPTGGAA